MLRRSDPFALTLPAANQILARAGVILGAEWANTSQIRSAGTETLFICLKPLSSSQDWFMLKSTPPWNLPWTKVWCDICCWNNVLEWGGSMWNTKYYFEKKKSKRQLVLYSPFNGIRQAICQVIWARPVCGTLIKIFEAEQTFPVPSACQ